MQKIESRHTPAIFTNNEPLICPLCRSENLQHEEKVDFQKVEDAWRTWHKMDIRTYFPKPVEELHLYRCNECNLGAFVPFRQTAPAQFYVELAQREPEAYFTPEKWEFNQAIKDLAGHKNVLEVGYGAGVFLKQAQAAGIGIHGVELSIESSQNQGWNNLPVLSESLESLAKKEEAQFDGVCSFQVLEHAADPFTFVEQCTKILKPGGTLIFAVPNDESYIRCQFNLLNLPPHHVTRWVQKSFMYMEHLFPLQLQTTLNEPLPTYQTQDYLNTWCEEKDWLGTLLNPKVRYQVGKLLTKTGFHQFLTGQTLYAKFIKR